MTEKPTVRDLIVVIAPAASRPAKSPLPRKKERDNARALAHLRAGHFFLRDHCASSISAVHAQFQIF